MSKPVVLIVDDEPDLLELVSLTLGRMSLETRISATVIPVKLIPPSPH